jgi:hypothetical protein
MPIRGPETIAITAGQPLMRTVRHPVLGRPITGDGVGFRWVGKCLVGLPSLGPAVL